MLDALFLLLMTMTAVPAIYMVSFDEDSAPHLTSPVATLLTDGRSSTRHAGSLEWRDARNQSKLYPHDIIATHEHSTAQVVFDNQDVIFLGPNSLIQIEEATPDSYHFFLLRGATAFKRKNKKVNVQAKATEVRIDREHVAIEETTPHSEIHVTTKNTGEVVRLSPVKLLVDFYSPEADIETAQEPPAPKPDTSTYTQVPLVRPPSPTTSSLSTNTPVVKPVDDEISLVLPATVVPSQWKEPQLPAALVLRPREEPPPQKMTPSAKPQESFAQTSVAKKDGPIEVKKKKDRVPATASAPDAPEVDSDDDENDEKPKARPVPPLSAYSWKITPHLGAESISGTDSAGRTSSVTASLEAGATLSAAWLWNPRWGISGAYSATDTFFNTPRNASSIQAPGLLSRFNLTAHFSPSSEWSLSGGLELGQAYFLLPTLTQAVNLNSAWIAKGLLDGQTTFAHAGRFSFNVDVSVEALAPGQSTYQIQWGYGGGARVSAITPVGESLKVGLAIAGNYETQVTGLGSQQTKRIGVEFSIGGFNLFAPDRY